MHSAVIYSLLCTFVFIFSARGEFAVNIRSSLDQSNPSIASDSNGNFVVVWSSYYSGKSNEIKARLFDKAGSAVSDELAINQTQAGNQKEPAVMMDGAGNFTVVWQGPGEDGNDIWCRKFDANGMADGNEFIVNSNRLDQQLSPEIAVNSLGRHIIVWESNSVPHAGAKAICGRLFDGNGSPIGNELVLSDGNDICRFPAAALSDAGKAVVAWVIDSATQEVRRRQFVADGNAPIYGSVKVNDPPNLNSLTQPVIAMDSAGNYVIAWDGHPNDHDEDDVYFRAYLESGAWQEQCRVNQGDDGAQRYPAAALYDNSRLVVLWEGDSGDENNKRDIFGRRFQVGFDPVAEPAAIGEEFRMNTYLYDDQRNAAICGRTDGTFVSVWQSQGQDRSQDGVFGAFGPVVGTADLDGDGFVDFVDYCGLGAQWMQQGGGLAADLIDDNKVDNKDVAAFCEQWLAYRYSCVRVNVSGDGGIDLKDFAVLARDWRGYGPLAGDIDGDGAVDLTDLQWLVLHWAQSCP